MAPAATIRPTTSPVRSFFFFTGRPCTMKGVGVATRLTVEGALVSLVTCGGTGPLGAGGTVNRCWQAGQLICVPEYSGVASIFCWQFGQENLNSFITGLDKTSRSGRPRPSGKPL